jgi:tripartite-type tricarboxylate transporter receptor subunit TctC
LQSIQRRLVAQGGIALALSAVFGSALAQTRRDMAKIYVGFAPGGMPDAVSRRIAQEITGTYAKAVVVENKAGAGGQIAVSELARQSNDGSNLLFTASAMLSVYPHVFKKLPYDSFTDVVPICCAGSLALAIAVGPMVPASVTDLKSLAAWFRANPQNSAYGSPGAGSPPHLLGMLYGEATKLHLAHAPYRGTQLAIADLLGKQLPVVISTQGEFFQHQKDGKLRVIAVTGKKRSQFLPEVPTVTEQGLPEIETDAGFVGFFGPKGTPPQVVQAAYAALKPALEKDAVVRTMHDFGIVPDVQPAETAARLLRSEFDSWKMVVERTGFKPDA